MSTEVKMSDVIDVGGKYYILAESSLADEQIRTLKQGETFGIFDRHGDIRPLGVENHGIYHEGTRFLSRFVMKIEDKSPLLLSSTVKEENDLLVVDLTNPDFVNCEGHLVQRGSLYLRRSIFLWCGTCYERIRIVNYARECACFNLSFQFDADYVDIFEVRGLEREERGEKYSPVIQEDSVVLAYEGLDRVNRRTHLQFDGIPDSIESGEIVYAMCLESQEERTCMLRVVCEIDESGLPPEPYETAFVHWRAQHEDYKRDSCTVETTNEQFNEWLQRSTFDLHMMLTDTDHGIYPYAGIPWFSTIFGRDGIITAIESLWLDPNIAEGVLRYLAATQATTLDPDREAQPGKILHEQRSGEMANLREIPFGQYYGTIDATPLFLILAGRYYERTGNVELIKSIWPQIELALAWIDDYGDADGDGFVEYIRSGNNGLVQQGWKDSDDSIFHADGSDAPAPIALCEVQGYVYEAKMVTAKLADVLKHEELAEQLRWEAEGLQKKFQERFWCSDLGMYALALDGDKRPCRVRSSNAGQCLFTGIASPDHAVTISNALIDESFFTGWGIRTHASGQARYNPMSYHNGSVWPHDNALIAHGMARYGQMDAAMKVFEGMFEASRFVNLCRLPELFCGFEKRRGEGPTLYPVACNPQAWASGSVFLLLEACMGLSFNAPEQKIHFNRPALPDFLDGVSIRNLRVGSAGLDVELRRHAGDVAVNVTRKSDEVEVVVLK